MCLANKHKKFWHLVVEQKMHGKTCLALKLEGQAWVWRKVGRTGFSPSHPKLCAKWSALTSFSEEHHSSVSSHISLKVRYKQNNFVDCRSCTKAFHKRSLSVLLINPFIFIIIKVAVAFIWFSSFPYFCSSFILFLSGFQNVLPPFSSCFSKTIDHCRIKKGGCVLCLKGSHTFSVAFHFLSLPALSSSFVGFGGFVCFFVLI